MAYRDDSLEGRLLAGDPDTVGLVIRWIASALASPRFWPLRPEWPDLHQEAMARVIESLRRQRFTASRDLRVYVQAVARYTAFEALSTSLNSPTENSLPGSLQDGAPTVEDVAASSQLARVVMEQATEECRRLIRAYFYDQMSYDEIAQTEGVPLGTVKSRLARCLERISRTISSKRSGRRPVAQD